MFERAQPDRRHHLAPDASGRGTDEGGVGVAWNLQDFA